MYKVLLVDDERWVVESLKSTIQWEKYGFEIVGQAYDGLEAYKRIKELKPHVTFVDIRMPKMSGLEVIKKVADEQIDTQFVIISAYAEFAYAQKALNCGAVDYCLKPFDGTEILRALQKVRGNLVKKPAPAACVYLNSASIEDMEDRETFEKLLGQYGLADAGRLLVLVSVGKERICFPEGMRNLTLKTGVKKWACLVPPCELDTLQSRLKGCIPDSIRGVGARESIGTAEEVSKAVEEANIAAFQFFISGESNRIVPASELTGRFVALNRWIKPLGEAIRNWDFPACDACLGNLSALFQSGHYSIRHAFFLYNMVMSLIYCSFSDPHEYFLDSYEQLPGLFGNVDDMLDDLRENIARQKELPSKYVSDNTSNDVIDKIIRYVNSNFYRNLSVQMISRKFFMDPNYISRLFRKKVGMTFTDYLAKLRIEYACCFLKEKKQMTIQQISEKAGFNDYFYFARVFKKVVGESPGVYRKKIIS